MDTVRMDKWLWAARFFKTRAMAAKACEMGRVDSNLQKAKPARDVRVGDLLSVKNEAGQFEIQVLGLSEARGPAATAQMLYRETEMSLEARRLETLRRKELTEFDLLREGKPSKKDRRDIDRLRGR